MEEIPYRTDPLYKDLVEWLSHYIRGSALESSTVIREYLDGEEAEYFLLDFAEQFGVKGIRVGDTEGCHYIINFGKYFHQEWSLWPFDWLWYFLQKKENDPKPKIDLTVADLYGAAKAGKWQPTAAERIET